MTTLIFPVWQPGRDPRDSLWNRMQKWVVVEKCDGPFWFWAIRNSSPFSYVDAKYLLIKIREKGAEDDDGNPKPLDWFAMRPYRKGKDKFKSWNGTVSVEEMYEKYGKPDDENQNPYSPENSPL